MIHAARSEATGTVLIESLAAGLPVVTSYVCGFGNYPAEVDPALVIGEKFEQSELNAAVLYALNNLDELKNKTIVYGSKADFYRRAQVAVDHMEKKQ
jgi:UDP-glucose:(heptosyl)LPS alpha-1,3-glucosyltransferase